VPAEILSGGSYDGRILKLHVELNGAVFDIDGNFYFNPEFLAFYKLWLEAAQGFAEVIFDNLIDSLEAQTVALASAVGASQTLKGGLKMDLTRLQAAVERDKTVNESAATLLGQLSDLIRATAGDPAAVKALADSLDAQQAALAAAVEANTPAPPAE
jgi:hypothetical protein